jgi:membrane protein
MIHGVSIKQFLRDLNHEISEDKVFNGAAALAYYLTLAIFPALILMMTLIPYLPIDRVDEAIMDLLQQTLPDESHEMVAGIVHEVTANRRGGLLSFGLLGTLWAASTGMHAVMQQLNVTYDVEEGRSFIRARGTALILSILFILLVIGAFSLIVLGGVLESWLESTLGFGAALLVLFATLRWGLIVLALLLGFAMIYRYAPNVERKFAFFSPGSIIGVALLIVASLGFTLYTSNFGDYDATYGSLGAMIMLMLWLYIAGLVILVGSEVNVLLERYRAQRRHSRESSVARRRRREYSWR